MRILAAKNGAGLGRLALIVKGLEVVGHRHQIGLRREFHGRVPPVAGGKDAEPTGLHKGFEFLLHRRELGFTVAGPVGDGLGQLGGLFRIGLEGRDHIHPVQGSEMVKMHDMILHRVLGHHDIPNILGVERHLNLEGMLHRADGRDGMHRGADAAETLGVDPGILGRTTLQDGLDAPPHLGG